MPKQRIRLPKSVGVSQILWDTPKGRKLKKDITKWLKEKKDA